MPDGTNFYITRIELHGGTEAKYTILHNAMTSQGFTRNITHEGQTVRLPLAEYAIRSSESTAQIKARAMSAAATTRLTFGLIVTQSSAFAQHGLSPV